MDLLASLVLLFLFLTLLLYLVGRLKPDGFPPGPPSLPIIGNALQLLPYGYRWAMEVEKKYGKIIGIQIGTRWVVLLNDPDDIREAFNKPEFSGRVGYNFFMDDDLRNANANHGVALSYGKVWADNRRFSLRTLRDFGFGKRSMENIIMEEVRDLVDSLKKETGKPISTVRIFNLSIFNVIWHIVAGQRYSLDDEELSKLTDLLLKFMGTVFKGGFWLLIFPELAKYKKILPFISPKDARVLREEMTAFMRKTIQEHRETREEGNPRDFIDAYLDEITKEGEGQKLEREEIGFIALLVDLFVAGAETTSTSLSWSFFLLALHPEAQEKLYQEIEREIGSREVLLEDRPKLPYAEATIMEIMRVSTIAPFAIPHAATEDTKFKGFHFPKGTQIFSNVYACHFDPAHWIEPRRFIPERFLSHDSKSVQKPKAWMPFGVGKRSCMGETLARDELFLFLSNLVKNFRISMPAEEPEHSMEGIRRMVNVPEPHRILLTVRAK